MNKWFYFNFLLLIVAAWKISTNYAFPQLHIHILFGMVALILILFNWTRHAVFSTIRSSTTRSKKIKYANLSKRILPFHRWIGTTALLLIVIHATLVINQFGFDWKNMKIVSGLLTGSVLVGVGVVISGWMRRIKPSWRKRITHLRLGLMMFFLILLHIIL
ncbi:hypothetical protein ACFQ3N_03015 [Virgibacillus byunsanensis]|uniref:Ferric oxidoreductase domain-containing protein n=1 Tax=Virgibacillus byunsanensis TaxID=570945 RepID=A0ABW3LG89_9BACI